jgi:hypothetical protein
MGGEVMALLGVLGGLVGVVVLGMMYVVVRSVALEREGVRERRKRYSSDTTAGRT